MEFEGSIQSQRLAVGVATTIEFTVPVLTRWILRSIQAQRPVSATIVITITDGTNELLRLEDRGAGTTTINIPQFENGNLMGALALIAGFPLKAGMTVLVTYGANQNATTWVSLIYEEYGAHE